MMKKLIAAVACLTLLGSAVAMAQDSTRNLPPKSLRQPAAKQDSAPVAPVGHRQPRADELPPETGSNDPGRIDAQDRELDRMIKGICKGC